jgi:hypothetical protein
MFTVSGVIIGAKIAAWCLGAIMTAIFVLANSGRAAGRAAAERGAKRRRDLDVG